MHSGCSGKTQQLLLSSGGTLRGRQSSLWPGGAGALGPALRAAEVGAVAGPCRGQTRPRLVFLGSPSPSLGRRRGGAGETRPSSSPHTWAQRSRSPAVPGLCLPV